MSKEFIYIYKVLNRSETDRKFKSFLIRRNDLRKASNEERHPLKLSTWVQREGGVNLAIKGI